MQTKSVILLAFATLGQARFGQEGSVQNIIQGLSKFGNPGAAGTLAGQSPGVLLAGANACAKVSDGESSCVGDVTAPANAPPQLELADKIVAELGTDAEVIAAAAALVAAEKNFNPFAQQIPTICSNAALPATAELRGIVPLVDPAVVGADVQNANSAKSLANPFTDAGLSVADISKAQGFANFTAQA
jgi:hypothetical protein